MYCEAQDDKIYEIPLCEVVRNSIWLLISNRILHRTVIALYFRSFKNDKLFEKDNSKLKVEKYVFIFRVPMLVHLCYLINKRPLKKFFYGSYAYLFMNDKLFLKKIYTFKVIFIEMILTYRTQFILFKKTQSYEQAGRFWKVFYFKKIYVHK